MDILKKWFVEKTVDDNPFIAHVYDGNGKMLFELSAGDEAEYIELIALLEKIVNAVNSLHTSKQSFREWFLKEFDCSYSDYKKGQSECWEGFVFDVDMVEKAWLASNVGRKQGEIKTLEHNGEWEAWDEHIEQQFTIGFGKTEKEAVDECIKYKESLIESFGKEMLLGVLKTIKINETSGATYKDAIDILEDVFEDNAGVNDTIIQARTELESELEQPESGGGS